MPGKRYQAEGQYWKKHPAKKCVKMAELESYFGLVFCIGIAYIYTTGRLENGANEDVNKHDVGHEDVITWELFTGDGLEGDNDEVVEKGPHKGEE